MDNVAEAAHLLIQLNDWIKQESAVINNRVGEFHDKIFSDVMEIIGNLHDPLVVDVGVATKHAMNLLEDYLNTIDGARKRINSTGHKLMRMQ